MAKGKGTSWTLREFWGKPVWDWLQLLGVLAIPVVIAVGGCMFNAQQYARQQQFENQRAEAEQELAQQRAQDEALQAYLDQMSSLLLDKDAPLRQAEVGDEVQILARARTATVMQRLDADRNGNVIRFLNEARLTGITWMGRSSISLLGGADLQGAHLEGVDLSYIDLSRANLTNTNLRYANLRYANLSDTQLRSANLRDADLFGANLRGANLRYTNNLRYANLRYANLSDTQLRSANLRGADLSDANLRYAGLKGANLRDANLRGADLRFARLSRANLSEAFLTNANLRGANLSNAYHLSSADLSNADLFGADGVTKEGLEQQAESGTLAGTIMPDRTIYPGRHAPREFEPALSFSVSDGWRLSYPQTTDKLTIEGPEGGQLIFTNPRHVYDPSSLSVYDPSSLNDPSSLSKAKKRPAPESPQEWVSWFQNHWNLETSKPVLVRVGGEPGMRIDVSTPGNFPQLICGEQPCVPLYPLGESVIVAHPPDVAKDQFVILNVGVFRSETVLIDVAAPAGKFDEFLPKAQKVVDTVEWEGG